MRNRTTPCYFKVRELLRKLPLLIVMLLFVSQGVFANNFGNRLTNEINSQFQEKEVKGVVIDAENKEPIPGVNVIIKGTTTGTVTDFDGNYTLTVPDENTVLVFSYIGYENQEIVVGNQSVLNVSMTMDVAGLDEVVIVAYGVQKKSNMTGAVTSVSAKDLKNTNASPSISSRLQSKVPGLYASGNSATPGSDPSIQIRGQNSLYGNNNPLWVVNGVIYSATTTDENGRIYNSTPKINPDDIESISVLKDASSTALYGSRAAGGVILVTTKSGKKDQSNLTFSYKRAVSKYNTGNFEVMNSEQLYNHFRTMFSTDYNERYRGYYETIMESNPDMSHEDAHNLIVNGFRLGEEDDYINKQFADDKDGLYPHLDTCTNLLDVNTNWADHAFRKGIMDQWSVSYTGGSEKLKTYLSGSYQDEEGILQGQDFKRYNGLANFDYQAYDRLLLKTQINLDYTDRLYQDGSSLYNTFIYMPWDDAYNLDGTIREVANNASTAEDGRKWYGRDGNSYLYPRQYNYTKSNSVNNSYNVGAVLDITDDLKFEHNSKIKFYNGYSFSNADVRTASGRADDQNGAIYQNYSKSVQYLTNSLLRYSKTFDEHFVSAVGGYEWEDYKYQNLNTKGTGVIPGAIIMDATSSADANKGQRIESATQSFLSNFNYAFKDRYLAQASLRYDQSSRFHNEHNGGTFFSVGAGWVVTKESFMNDLWMVDYLKFRTSYGSVGNMYPKFYQPFGIYGFGFKYNDVPGLFPSRPDVYNLSWEKKYDFNAAIDFRVLNRIGGTIEFYNSKTTDLFLIRELSTLTGFNSQVENIGSMRNRGIELSLNPQILKGGDFQWDVAFNITFNRNEIISVGDGVSHLDRGSKIWQPGLDANTFYMREWAGVDSETGDPLWKYMRENADGTFTDTLTSDWNKAEKRIQDETSSPKFYGGFVSNMYYKNFSLTAVFNYVYGNKIYYSGREFFDNDGAYPEYNQMVYSEDMVRWEKPGDIATHPKLLHANPSQSNKQSTRYLEDGSYLRLGNLALGYTLRDNAYLSKLKISEINFSLSVENVFTLTNFSGVNPEVGIGGYAGNDISPVIRKYIFGFSVSF